ncbi:MAG: hypothetical protein V4597_11455 [Pseudomonadota bacterium]
MSATAYRETLRYCDDLRLRERCLESFRCYLRARGWEVTHQWDYCLVARDECDSRGLRPMWDECYAEARQERRAGKGG